MGCLSRRRQLPRSSPLKKTSPHSQKRGSSPNTLCLGNQATGAEGKWQLGAQLGTEWRRKTDQASLLAVTELGQQPALRNTLVVSRMKHYASHMSILQSSWQLSRADPTTSHPIWLDWQTEAWMCKATQLPSGPCFLDSVALVGTQIALWSSPKMKVSAWPVYSKDIYKRTFLKNGKNRVRSLFWCKKFFEIHAWLFFFTWSTCSMNFLKPLS